MSQHTPDGEQKVKTSVSGRRFVDKEVALDRAIRAGENASLPSQNAAVPSSQTGDGLSAAPERCPFCGARPRDAYVAYGAWRVVCSCNVEGPCNLSKESAIRAWNIRTPEARTEPADRRVVDAESETAIGVGFEVWWQSYLHTSNIDTHPYATQLACRVVAEDAWQGARQTRKRNDEQ